MSNSPSRKLRRHNMFKYGVKRAKTEAQKFEQFAVLIKEQEEVSLEEAREMAFEFLRDKALEAAEQLKQMNEEKKKE